MPSKGGLRLPFRKRLAPEDLIESATERFHGKGLSRDELHEIATGAFETAADEFSHGGEHPLQLYARKRIDEEIRRALTTR